MGQVMYCRSVVLNWGHFPLQGFLSMSGDIFNYQDWEWRVYTLLVSSDQGPEMLLNPQCMTAPNNKELCSPKCQLLRLRTTVGGCIRTKVCYLETIQ